ncbi:hypothetical protein E4U43_000935 [Claviceps pusilla]|uniref:Oxidoreductase molybdopterin-binding domain-containing protein n=1 Tax=Claviceps pusilla TaxID=123648 RepID=A0A9P7SYN8_9HYPO|nr:hypothetical protein E4U43_000935 [Claviceps pusilla]
MPTQARSVSSVVDKTTRNRPDEWKIEQGHAAAALPVLDMTGPQNKELEIQTFGPLTRDEERKLLGLWGMLMSYLPRRGKDGFVEWENHPDKKAAAHKILTSRTLSPPNAEYQLGEILGTNPALRSARWAMWHRVLGAELGRVPDDSWETVLKEKHPDMLHLLQFPYNGEPPKGLVTEKDMTPNALHFVRNHGGNPLIDARHYKFSLDGLVARPGDFTLDDLMDTSRFGRMERTMTMQCSGTRRIEQMLKYPGQGDEVPQAPWAEGAIGTTTYVGASLKKMVKACGGLVGAFPWSKVKANEVMLAWAMNGDALPAIHGYPGYPLRVTVLGYFGARSGQVAVSDQGHPVPRMGLLGRRTMAGATRALGRRRLQLVHGSSGEADEEAQVDVADLAFPTALRRRELDRGCVPLAGTMPSARSHTQPPDVRTDWNWGLHVTSSCHRTSVYSVNKARLDEFDERGIPFGPITVRLAFPFQTREDYAEFWDKNGGRDAEDE